MKRYLFLSLSAFLYTNAMAIDYSGNTIVDSFNDTEITVQNGAVINPANGYSITIEGPVHLYNNGTINGVIDANEYNLFVYNNGVISGGIINTNGGNITQIINPEFCAGNVDIDGDFIVRIENIPNLNFSDIQNIRPTYFKIENTPGVHTVITIDNFAQWQEWNQTVKISEPISLVITDENVVNYDGVTIGNILKESGGDIDVQIIGLDGAIRADREYFGNRFKLKISRDTNYGVINNGKNAVIEKIKNSNPNDKFIKALNSANNTDEINRIVNRSYRFNHGILLRPIHVINNFALMDIIKDKNDFGLGFKPVYIVSDKISDIGGRIYIGNHYNDFYFYIGLSLNHFEYSDEINDFSGFVYGTDIRLKQYFNKLWINGTGGINLTKFKANYVSSNNQIKNDPYGVSWYIETDVGYDFNIADSFIISPFAGVEYQNYKVTDASDNDFNIHGGAGAKYYFVTDGIKYEYALDAAVISNGNLFSSLKFSFWSITDEAGATLSVGVLKDDWNYNYQLSLDAKILF